MKIIIYEMQPYPAPPINRSVSAVCGHRPLPSHFLFFSFFIFFQEMLTLKPVKAVTLRNDGKQIKMSSV